MMMIMMMVTVVMMMIMMMMMVIEMMDIFFFRKVRATRYKSRAIIEAEQNIFRHFHKILHIVGFSRLISCIFFYINT